MEMEEKGVGGQGHTGRRSRAAGGHSVPYSALAIVTHTGADHIKLPSACVSFRK